MRDSHKTSKGSYNTSKREFATAKRELAEFRSEAEIRADLREQLEAIHKRYLKKWVWNASSK